MGGGPRSVSGQPAYVRSNRSLCRGKGWWGPRTSFEIRLQVAGWVFREDEG